MLSIIVFTFLYLPASAAHLTARWLVYHLLFWDCLPLGKVDDPAACKARLQGFSLEQEFAVIVDKSNKDAFIEFLCIHHSAMIDS